MESSDLSFRITYVPRSTRCTPLFHELEDSNSYLYEATEVKSSSSGLGDAKQVFNDDEEGEWKRCFGSKQLDSL